MGLLFLLLVVALCTCLAAAHDSCLVVYGLRDAFLGAQHGGGDVGVHYKLSRSPSCGLGSDAHPVAHRGWVTSSSGETVFDSGALPTALTLGALSLRVDGLAPLRRYTFHVAVSDGGGQWSAPASADLFIGPGPALSDWGAASWLCTGPGSTDTRSSMLRGTFTLPAGRPVSSAVAFVTGLGSFLMTLNGVSVSSDANVPGWTAWGKRILYSTYPLPPSLLVEGGGNAVGLLLGNGMYNVPPPGAGRYTKWEGSSGPRMALLKLVVTFADGGSVEVDTTTSTGGWVATDGGPIVFTHQYAGEDVNASLAVPGWDTPSFLPGGANPSVTWTPAQDCSALTPGGALLPSTFDPVRVVETLPAVSINATGQAVGSVLVDVGRNFAGRAVVNVTNIPPGYALRVWPSETLRGGVIDQSSGGTPMYWQHFPTDPTTDTGPVTLRPTFSTYGWRWLQVQLVPLRDAAVQPARGPYNGTLAVLQASYGLSCGAGNAGDATGAVAAWCNGKAECPYPVCVCGDNTCGAGAPPCLPDPAPNCAKDFNVTWVCSGDPAGETRGWYLPPEADNGVLPLTCGPMPAPPHTPIVTGAAGEFMRSSVATVGSWNCSSAWVNAIHAITLEAVAANLQSVLTDCPHRERLGWLEVSHLMFPSIAYNFDVHALWGKISLDTVDSQTANGMVPDIAPEYTVFSGGFRDSPEWGSAAILNPGWVHAWYGDVAVLNATYPTGLAYVSYLLSQRKAASGLLAYGLGDWIPVLPSPPGVTATGVLVQDLQALSRTAGVLGQPGDAANFSALSFAVGGAYQAAFWAGGNASFPYPTQCAGGIALALGITPPTDVGAAQAFMLADVARNGNVTTSGEIGNRYALLALAAIPPAPLGGGVPPGVAAVWGSLLRTTAPGYGWMLSMGETALAETWFDSAGDSHIHAMYGHVDEFLYTAVAGIRQLDEGEGEAGGKGWHAAPGGSAWRCVLLAPALLPGTASTAWVNASFDSPRGLITAYVVVGPSGGGAGDLSVEVHAQVPPGVSAWVDMPLSGRRVRLPLGGTPHVLREAGPDPRE